MLAVTKIEVANVDRRMVEIAHMPPVNSQFSPCLETEMPEIAYEMIHGKQFVNSRGEYICIGMSQQVQDAIGLPLEAFDNMNNRISDSTFDSASTIDKKNTYLLFESTTEDISLDTGFTR